MTLYENLMSTRDHIHHLYEQYMTNRYIAECSKASQVYPTFYEVEVSVPDYLKEDAEKIEELSEIVGKQNEAFLNAFEEAASATNPIGLVADKVSATTPDPSSMDLITTQFKEALKSNDMQTVDGMICKIVDPMCSLDLGTGCCSKNSLAEACTKREEKRKLERDDVKEAIEKVKNAKSQLQNVANKAKKTVGNVVTKISNTKKTMQKAAKECNSGKMETCKAEEVMGECSMVAIYSCMEAFDLHKDLVAECVGILEECRNARDIIFRTAAHDPRNLKESIPYTDAIGECADQMYADFIDSVL